MSGNDDILKRLREIARSPADLALDVCFTSRAKKQRSGFCRSLLILLNVLTDYHNEP